MGGTVPEPGEEETQPWGTAADKKKGTAAEGKLKEENEGPPTAAPAKTAAEEGQKGHISDLGQPGKQNEEAEGGKGEATPYLRITEAGRGSP